MKIAVEFRISFASAADCFPDLGTGTCRRATHSYEGEGVGALAGRYVKDKCLARAARERPDDDTPPMLSSAAPDRLLALEETAQRLGATPGATLPFGNRSGDALRASSRRPGCWRRSKSGRPPGSHRRPSTAGSRCSAVHTGSGNYRSIPPRLDFGDIFLIENSPRRPSRRWSRSDDALVSDTFRTHQPVLRLVRNVSA